MCKKSISSYILFVALFSASGFLSGPAKAGDMVITSVFPANNAVEVCADTKLWITFGTAPIVSTDRNMHLQICRVSDNNVVYQLDLNALPRDSFGPVNVGYIDSNAVNWPYKINQNGRTENYEPFAVDGNTVEIQPSKYPLPSPCLDYNTAYYVKMTAGFCTDAGGNTSPEINDSTTWQFTTKAAAPAADHDYTVALDGSGDFCTLQGAADAVVNNDPCRTIVKVKKGTYREIVNIPGGKTNMTWLGEDRDTAIMAAYNFEGFNPGSDYRMLIRGSANGFRMYNMTFHNLRPKAGGNNQAEITKHSGQKSIVKNCKFMSYQDTLCLNGQMYLKDCYVEGDVDFVWGYGTVYFDECEIRILTTKGYITQPRQGSLSVNGLFFVDCNLTGRDANLTNCYLGRGAGASYPYGQTAYINCTMPRSLFYPVGWLLNGTGPNDLRFWEYKSAEPNGTLIDVSQRLNPGSKQLDDNDIDVNDNGLYWRDANHVFGNWNPQDLNQFPPTASWQPFPADGATGVDSCGVTLTWAAGAEAASHIVYFGTANPPGPVGEQTGTSFATGTMSPSTTYYWAVDENNPAGQTAGTVWSFTTSYICTGSIVSDLDNNCEVDFFDYALLAEAWGSDPPEVDLNTDGFLDYSDIAQFAIDWLKCHRDPQSMCWQ